MSAQADPRIVRIIADANVVDLELNRFGLTAWTLLAVVGGLAGVVIGGLEIAKRAHFDDPIDLALRDRCVIAEVLLVAAVIATFLALRSLRARAEIASPMNHEIWKALVERGSRIVWIYPQNEHTQVTITTSYGQRMEHYDNAAIVLGYDDGQTFPLDVTREERAQRIRDLADIFSSATIGYSKEREDAFKRVPAALRRALAR